MRSRAFTLMEVVVVMGVLLALASVVVPIAVTSARAGRVDDAGVQVEAAMAMARADAQRQSAPVRVMARTLATGEVEVYSEAVALGVPSDEEIGGVASTPAASERSLGTCVLPRGVTVRDRLAGASEDEALTGSAGAEPRVAGAGLSVSGPDGEVTAAGAGGDATSVLLAVFMPDGEVLGPGPRYLVDGHGRVAEVRVDCLSGRVRVVTMGKSGGGAGASANSIEAGGVGER